MKFDYIVILAIMVVASYFLFIRKPKAKPADNADNNASGNDERQN